MLEDFGDDLPEEAAEWLGMIRDDANKMAGVVDALYKFSALRCTEDDLELAPVDLNQVLRNIHKDKAQRGSWNGSKMVWPDMPIIHANRMMLTEVMANLADNAYKYNPNQDKLLEWVWEPDTQDGWVRIGLKDNGLGLTQHLIDNKLFQLFQRVHPEFEATGHGVGLTTCRYLVMKMGGRIWAESGGPGKGSTFWFTARVYHPYLDALLQRAAGQRLESREPSPQRGSSE
jgi:light-regulated signal transduction histidine kinase (bacteriophytochrome)